MARKLPLWEQKINKFESIFWDTHTLDDLVEAVNKELPVSGASEIPELHCQLGLPEDCLRAS